MKGAGVDVLRQAPAVPDEKTKPLTTLPTPPPGSTVATQDVLTDPLAGRIPSLSGPLPAYSPVKKQRHSPLDQQGVLDMGTRGSGSMVTTVSSQVDAHDGQLSATRAFLHQKKSRPGISDDLAWQFALEYDLNPGGEYTELRGTEKAKGGGEKKAYVVGNSNYEFVDDLPGAKADAASMVSHYQGQGYKAFHIQDVKAAQLKNGIEAFGGLKEGDQGVLYYAGHGTHQGLLGVDVHGTDGLVPRSVISSTTSKALSNGAQLDVVIDACQAGAIQTQLEKDLGKTSKSKDMNHVDSYNSAKSGYGIEASNWDEAYDQSIMQGVTTNDGWKIRNPKGIEVEEY